MLHRHGLFQVLPQLVQLDGVPLAESLHLGDGLVLVEDERLVPLLRESFELSSVLLLDADLLANVLVNERNLQARLGLLADLHDLLKLMLRLSPVSLSFVDHPHPVEGLPASEKDSVSGAW